MSKDKELRATPRTDGIMACVEQACAKTSSYEHYKANVEAARIGIEDLERELAEARRDAERYRWLRSDHPVQEGAPFIARLNLVGAFSRWTDEHADAAIDAARKDKP